MRIKMLISVYYYLN